MQGMQGLQNQQGMHGMQSQQNMPVPPTVAAAEFRRVNKGLPDGVRYEPLDDQTMKLLQDNGHIPKPPANPAAPSPPAQNMSAPQMHQPPPMIPLPLTPMSPAPQALPAPPKTITLLSEEIAHTLEDLSQDERNAHVFYSHFSENASNDSLKQALDTLAKDSETRLKQYINLIATHFDRQYTPRETEINTNLSIAEAINLALTEENKALVTLGNLLDQAANTEAESSISRIISRKLIANQLLATLQR